MLLRIGTGDRWFKSLQFFYRQLDIRSFSGNPPYRDIPSFAAPQAKADPFALTVRQAEWPERCGVWDITANGFVIIQRFFN